VVYIDRYGNAITGIRASTLAEAASLSVNGYALTSASTFSDVDAGQAFWYANSNGLVELAVNHARADEVLGITVGSEVTLEVMRQD
jgi:S-adenosylmethionine hydrolase